MLPRGAVALLLGSWMLSSGSASATQQQFRISTSMVLLDVSDRAKYGRQVIVLWTDGADLDSHSDFGALETAPASSPASLYAVGQYQESARKLYLTGEKYFKKPAFDENLNPVRVVGRLAELSGGEALFPASTAEPAPLFEDIAQTFSDST